ncbi:hypothetical protein FRC09_005539 [Ceratobasidium sp. 395]|nr:hypothetical protein FRC09_005539 [Ceratobasidium sp. 395]
MLVDDVGAEVVPDITTVMVAPVPDTDTLMVEEAMVVTEAEEVGVTVEEVGDVEAAMAEAGADVNHNTRCL